ncbi:ABC transporter ATP-binding protein [Leucobacter chinensis]|uniref:ABC transporter ATP-binding protein n=1 Tax=Leucobacter chinensis TaxID=2851010 RepID=UPI001C23194B|nr:ABC transporter ATP-binding protein [Leucobacter chinensis]
MNPALTLQSFGAMRGGKALAAALSIRLEPGTVLGVVGPNGVGKSSLLQAIAGAGVAHYGEALYDDASLQRMRAKERARVISLLAQDTGAPDELLVHELVSVGSLAGGRSDLTGASYRALEESGIGHLAQRRFGTLSGGQQQLVQLARVLAQDTPVVVLDEPTAALDLLHQRAVEQTMRRLGNDGKIVIAAVHDLSLALNSCTRVLLLDRTGGTHIGEPRDVLAADLVHQAYGVHTEILTAPGGRHILSPTESVNGL